MRFLLLRGLDVTSPAWREVAHHRVHLLAVVETVHGEQVVSRNKLVGLRTGVYRCSWISFNSGFGILNCAEPHCKHTITFGNTQTRGLSRLANPPGKCRQISPINSTVRGEAHEGHRRDSSTICARTVNGSALPLFLSSLEYLFSSSLP
jgi:hypothetical protein